MSKGKKRHKTQKHKTGAVHAALRRHDGRRRKRQLSKPAQNGGSPPPNPESETE